MLKAHAWKSRGHPFVCASCRQKLSTTTRQVRDRTLPSCAGSLGLPRAPQHVRLAVLQPRSARHLSTTALLYNSAESGNAPRPGGFPGGFAGKAGGAWGSFASGANRPAQADDGLLPHEREARQRTTGAPAPAKETPASGEPGAGMLNRGLREGQPRKDSNKRGPNEAQAKMSRSVLADVFNTNREPRSPPTPKSWSTRAQQSDGSGPQELNGSPSSTGTGSATSERDSYGKGLFNNRKAALHESPKASGGGSIKNTGWGSFSSRKAQTPGHGHGHGNESSIWSEITRSSRPKAIPHLKMKSASSSEPVAGQSKADVPPAEQDFWGELETRVADFKGNSKARREKAAAETSPKRLNNKPARTPRDTDAQQLGGVSPRDRITGHKVEAGEEPQKQRRKSRFELEEEEKLEDRRSKKPTKPQKGRRMQEEDDWDDEAIHRWEQRQRREAAKQARKKQALREEPKAVPIHVPEYISASNLAQALKQRLDQFMKDMEEMGFENVTPDTIMTGDTAALIAMEYGFEPTVDTGSQRDLKPRPIPEDVSALPGRPPVVTIMGHVDHGKTTLLDWLRKSSVAAHEHGGITQHIGAFVVKMSSGKAITFLDTPGHAAFLSMRQRGANVTDIVVLVVAADDSVMPQTIEALKHATAAKVPIIVAINKIDKEDARVDQVKADLSRHGVEIEDFGGDVQVVCVSGKTGLGMDDLEENILTLSEMLDVRAETDGMAEGWILESSVKQNGKAATVLVKRGTLRPGDFITAGKTWARIRALRNEAGVELSAAPPGTPVEILGWRELPDAGEQVLQSPDEARAKTAVEYRLEMAEREESSVQLAEQEQRQREKAALEAAEAAAKADGVEPTTSEVAEPGILYQNFTVKADVVGSVEAVCSSILELGNHEVQPKILRSSAGQISEYDIDHAAASNSVIVNFNVPILPHIKQRAEEAKVKILDHSVIYHVVDDAKATLSGLLPMSVTYRVSGEADILQVFPINVKKRDFKNIAGCRVRNGAIKRSSRVKVLRKGQVIFDGLIDTLKHVKKDVMEMGKGTECGIGLEGFEGFKVDDQIQTYEEVKEKRTL